MSPGGDTVRSRRQSDRGETGTPPQQKGSEIALEEIAHHLAEHRTAFRAFLLRRVSDEAVAEDLLQQSLMRAVVHHRALQKTDSAVSWFYRILRNAVVDYYRSRAAEARKVDNLLREIVTAGDDQTPSMDDIRPTICVCLDILLAKMRPTYAELIRRMDLQGEPAATVARELGVTTNNVTVRLHRARQALKGALEQACGVCTKHGCLNCTCGESRDA